MSVFEFSVLFLIGVVVYCLLPMGIGLTLLYFIVTLGSPQKTISQEKEPREIEQLASSATGD